MKAGSTKVLFVAGDPPGSSASTVRVLLERGCVVSVVVDGYSLARCGAGLEQLRQEHPSVHWDLVQTVPFDAWSNLGRQLYLAIDRLRGGHAGSSTTAGSAPLVGVAERVLGRSRPGRWLFERLLGACELAVPRSATIDALVRGHNPDIVLIADVAPGSPGVECGRSARALGVPAVVCAGPTEVALLALDTVSRRRPRGRVWWAPLMRRALARQAHRYAHTPSARMEKAARDERNKSARFAAVRASKGEARAAKQRHEEATVRRREQSAARAAAKRENEARAYERYLNVREWAREMRDSNDDALAVSPSEQRTRDALAHLWHAEPATIATLRHSCEPISGSRASDYDPPSVEVKSQVRRGIVSMRRWAGDDLLVSEPAALGGFGCSIGNRRYNADTVKFFNTLVALRDAAVLGTFERPTTRGLVWEIGGGWGGFAYQFKTICPNVTYVITGLPELLLVSAVYLMTLVPEARVRFHRAATAGDLWRNWEDVDFVFAPEPALVHCRPPRLDLTLDLAVLSEMTPPRVRSHLRTAYEAGSRYFYSLRSASGGDDATFFVRRAIEEWYWPHPVPPRIEAAEEKEYAVGKAWSDAEYTHLVGWRRIHA